MKRYWCYIMSNKSRKLYVGFTDDLVRRVIEHKQKLYPRSFTARYVFDMLVWYEEYGRVVSEKMREKEILMGARPRSASEAETQGAEGLTLGGFRETAAGPIPRLRLESYLT